jgi:uncharacterized OsmC-like protein
MNNPRPVKTPSRILVRIDAAGITAVNDRGDEIRYAVSPSAPGFNPLELLSASLGICTAINLRKELGGTAGRASSSPFEVAVECVKAEDPPSRVERMQVSVHLPHDVTGAAAGDIVRRAEAACTIANTLLASAGITNVSDIGNRPVE